MIIKIISSVKIELLVNSNIMSSDNGSKIFDIDGVSLLIFMAIVPKHESTLFADSTNQTHVLFCNFIIIILIDLFAIVVVALGCLLLMHFVNFFNDIFLKISHVCKQRFLVLQEIIYFFEKIVLRSSARQNNWWKYFLKIHWLFRVWILLSLDIIFWNCASWCFLLFF